MKNKQRKLSILLCLLLILVPIGNTVPVYASGNSKALQAGTSAITTGNKLWFGNYGGDPIDWQVTGTNRLSLLSQYILFDAQYHAKVNEVQGFLTYQTSELYTTTLPNFKNNTANFSTAEQGVMGKVGLPASGGVATKRGETRSSNYWLGKEFEINTSNGQDWYYGYYVYGSGSELISDLRISYGVRPACELNRSSVLFVSAAVGGKTSGAAGADALKSVSDYSGNEWKLTLKDSSRDGFSAQATAYDKTNKIVTIHYQGATFSNDPASNEYLSAILKGNDGSIKYYGQIAKPAAEEGSCTINLNGKIAAGDKLYVFSEQVNDNNKTDYASALQEIDMTPPTLTAGKVQRIGDSAATVSFTSDKAGQYYYQVVESGATPPTIDYSGTGTSCGTSENILSLTLTSSDAKDVYIVVKDAVGNVSAPLKMQIPAYIAPSYILSTTPSALDFGSAYSGYTAPAEKTVTVKNEGNQDVKFTLPTIKNYNISVNGGGGSGSDINITSGAALDLSIAPRAGLPAGEYNDTLTITGTNGASTSVALKFEVKEKTYALVASPSSLSFGSLNAGYTKPAAQTVTVTNQGNQEITLTAPTASKYEIGTLSNTLLAPNETATFIVNPKAGLPAGNQDETLIISGSNGAGASVALKFSVTALPPAPTPSSGGSSSASSPNSISAIIPDATINDPYPAVIGLIKPQVRLDSDRTVWVDITTSDIENAIRQAKELASGQKLTKNGIALQIDLSGISSHFDQLPLNLPKEAYERMIDAGVKHFTVITPQLTLSLDVDSLKTIVQSAADSSITLDAKVVDTKKLVEQKKISQDIRTAFGDRPLYDFTIKSGKEFIHQLGSGFAKISLPYVPSATENKNELRLTTVDENGKLIEISDSKYENGSIVGKTNHFSLYGITIAKKETATLNIKTAPEFQDTQHHWAKEAIGYVAAHRILNGTSKDRFSPDQTVTRGMFVTALYHLAQENQSTVIFSPMPFSDVAPGSYYEAAIQWAAQNHIVSGIGQKQFAPEQAISREQLMTMLYQYSKVQGYDTTQGGMATREYSDYALISPWAQPAMVWTVHSGLLSGMNDGTLAPRSTATRAQLASILMHFMQKIVK